MEILEAAGPVVRKAEGRQRDDSRKIHDCLVSCGDMADEIRRYDRDTVRAFPEIMTKAEIEVRRS